MSLPPEVASPPPPPTPSPRAWRLSLLMVILVVVMAAPLVAERISYAINRGREEARIEVARAHLTSLSHTTEVFRLVAQSVGPSVVHIDADLLEARHDEPADEWSFHRGLRRFTGQGSGVIVDAGGYIVTNYHVVAQAQGIRVRLSDGRTVKQVKLVGFDSPTDLAVLQIAAERLVPSPWGDSTELDVGSWVLAVGNPFGLDRTVTAGIVSAKNRRGLVNGSRYQNFIQTDAAVNPGNSGGPLVNLAGEIVGINTAIYGESYQGISFAIPSEIARDVYERIKSDGRVARAWLGVLLEDLNSQLAAQLDIDTLRGVLVAEVLPDSPAALGGLEAGDVIVRFNGGEVHDSDTLRMTVARTPIDSEVSIDILRDGKEQTLQVVVTERFFE